MTNSMIYRTEPMATRALAAEIRNDPAGFVALLEERSGRSFGPYRAVQCEVKRAVRRDTKSVSVRLDNLLEFDGHVVAIEAKLDHELTQEQIEDQLLAIGTDATLFVLLPNPEAAPDVLAKFPQVSVIGWSEVLACFDSPRLTMDDINAYGLLKSTVETWLGALELGKRLPEWEVQVRRGGSGMPSVTFQSPVLVDGRTMRGHLGVAGRGMPDVIDDVRFDAHLGISVDETSPADFFSPKPSDRKPDWVGHLEVLYREVLADDEVRLRINKRAPGPSTKGLGIHKVALAKAFLQKESGTSLMYLAKGYTDWALGPKIKDVSRDQLEELANIVVEIFTRWSAAVTTPRA